ncbi:MAG: flavodoxin family protein [Deltaproteobacteria bacterium]|nr:MAG: flavodoxin family protein [Deltaproteobacteria bacterium]
MKVDISQMTPNKGILGFSGSPRRNGNSDILLKNILEAATQENITCEHYNLTNIQFQGCIGCEKCRKDKICTGLIDGMSVMYDQIISTQGLVLVSPTHNYNITSWMKAFIDRLYCFYNFEKDHPRSWSSQLANQNRKAVVAAICEQENEEDMGYTIEAMAKPLEALGYEIVGKLSVFKIFEKGKIKKDPNAIEQASELGKKLAKSLETQ